MPKNELLPVKDGFNGEANCLETLADPACRFHADYLEYKRGRIRRAELMRRLPHVAMIGDSVCTGIHISTAWSTLWRARTCRGNNWFLDANPNNKIRSVSRRLEELTPFVARELGGVGALVDEEGERQNVFRRILGTRNFSGQVDQVVKAKRFPDLILISIGHNNADWTWWCPSEERDCPDASLQQQSECFRQNYQRQLLRLIERAEIEQHRVAIVIFGLVNFGSYFKGREAAERLRASNAALYPHLETTYKYFTSFRPAYRRNLIRLAVMMNERLRGMVTEINYRGEHVPNLQVRYSDALATVDLSRAEFLHAVDGWHASAAGHNALARAAFNDLGPSLEFLGIP